MMCNIQMPDISVKVMLTAIAESCLRITICPEDMEDPFAYLNGRYLSKEVKKLRPGAVLTNWETKKTVGIGRFHVSVRLPLEMIISDDAGNTVQKLSFDVKSGDVRFPVGAKELFGLGQGFPTPMDRRGYIYDMKRHGQERASVFEYAAISAVPYIISREGWGLFFHEPARAVIDLSGEIGVYSVDPKDIRDIFVIKYDKPEMAARMYYDLTGRAPIPPKYAFGYQQSYRELLDNNGQSIVMPTARYMRAHQIPCDMLIYLGRYVQHGWNLYTHNGMFEFNPATFPQPLEMMQELHDRNYRVALHITETPSALHGDVNDNAVNPLEYDHVKNYWSRHEKLHKYAGNDGWWPDDGDELDLACVNARHRMYHDGTEKLTPNKRGFYMLRNSYCGDAQYGGIIWSGDVLCNWAALKNHVFVGLNVGMSLNPYWGSDIGGFHVTSEYSGELYVRWLEYAVFNPMMRSHGRHSFLHTPWGWKHESLKDIPDEWSGSIAPNMVDAVLPDFRVEPICKKFIELRYRLIPYIYTLARQAWDRGTPFMRPMWFDYAGDEQAASCQSQYMLGRYMLVNPVTKKGAASWTTYLPEGKWYDFFTNEQLDGGREVTKQVGLEDIPVYIPAGAILPMGEVKQCIGDKPIDQMEDQMTLYVYEGKDGNFALYEDDGITKDYMEGKGTYTHIRWDDCLQKLSVAGRSSQIAGRERSFDVFLIASNTHQRVTCCYQEL